MRKFKVTIGFKSGVIREFETNTFKVIKSSQNEITKLEYTGSIPQILFINLDDIDFIEGKEN